MRSPAEGGGHAGGYRGGATSTGTLRLWPSWSVAGSSEEPLIPVVTPTRCAIDAARAGRVLIDRAGGALLRAALRLLGAPTGGGSVVAGKGNNGADGRSAALMSGRGVHVTVTDAADAPAVLPPADLRRRRLRHRFPRHVGHARSHGRPSSAPTSRAASTPPVRPGRRATGGPHRHVRNLEPGLLFPPGSTLAGGQGIDNRHLSPAPSSSGTTARWLPAHRPTHAGRPCGRGRPPGMLGAAHLSARTQRAGAGYVRLTSPGVVHDTAAPTEGWAGPAVVAVGGRRPGRIGPVPRPVVGPGLASRPPPPAPAVVARRPARRPTATGSSRWRGPPMVLVPPARPALPSRW